MTDEIFDVCFTVQGPNADAYLPICMESLRRKVDLSGVWVHLINRGCKDSVVDYMRSLCSGSRFVFHDFGEEFHEVHGPDDYSIPQNMEMDTSAMCHWMVDNGGDADVVFICHFDVEFLGDIFARYRRVFGRKVGQVGEHSDGVVGYRRKAVRQSAVTFRSLSHFQVRESARTGAWKIRSIDDRRGERVIAPVSAFDIGELLELDIRYRSWDVVTIPQGELDDLLRHFKGGSGYHGGDINVRSREIALQKLFSMGLSVI